MADQRFLELIKSGSISEITKYMKSSFNDVIKADPHKYTELCQVMANNQNLSTANTLLVYLQDPHAKLVSDILDMATFGRKLINTKEIALYTNKSINYAYDLADSIKDENDPERKHHENFNLATVQGDNEELKHLSGVVFDEPYEFTTPKEFFSKLADYVFHLGEEKTLGVFDLVNEETLNAAKATFAQILSYRFDANNAENHIYNYFEDISSINLTSAQLKSLHFAVKNTINYISKELATIKKVLKNVRDQTNRERFISSSRSQEIIGQSLDRGSLSAESGERLVSERQTGNNPDRKEDTSEVSNVSDREHELSSEPGISRLEDNVQQQSSSGRQYQSSQRVDSAHAGSGAVQTDATNQSNLEGRTSELHAEERSGDRGSFRSNVQSEHFQNQSSGSSSVRSGTGAGISSSGNSTSVDGDLRSSTRSSNGGLGGENSNHDSATVLNRAQGEGLSADHGISSENSVKGEFPSSEGERLGTSLQNKEQGRVQQHDEINGQTSVQSNLQQTSEQRLSGLLRTNGGVEPAVEAENADQATAVLEDPLAAIVNSNNEQKVKGSNHHLDNDTLSVSYYSNYDKYINRVNDNIEALEKLHQITVSNQTEISAEDQKVLAKYTGWGGIPVRFIDKDELINDTHVTPEEYQGILSSLNSAFFTNTNFIDPIYNKLAEFGFKGGKILEPSCGTGKFIGRLPESMSNSEVTGIEIDPLTCKITKLLYPNANIKNTGFEKTTAENYYDVAIGNVPFGQLIIKDHNDPELSDHSIHNYFFLKALKEVHPNGVVAFLTSSFTLDATGTKTREEIAKKARFLGAVRLPDTAFSSSGTEVVTDLIFLQKREHELEEIDLNDPEFSWVKTSTRTLPDPSVPSYSTDKEPFREVNLNNYFIEHPNQVLGDLFARSTAYGYKVSNTYFNAHIIQNSERTNSLSEDVINDFNQALKGISLYQSMDYVPSQDITVKTNNTDVKLDEYFDNARNFSFYLDGNGKILYKKTPYQMPETDHVKKSNLKVATALIKLRDEYRNLRNLEINDSSEDDITASRQRLNAIYDDFYNAHSKEVNENKSYLPDIPVGSKPVIEYFLRKNPFTKKLVALDHSFNALLSLEKVNSEGLYQGKSDAFSKRILNFRQKQTSAKDPTDALIMSINEKGKIDIPYIGSLLHTTDLRDVTAKLIDEKLIYRDPKQMKFDENNAVVPFTGYVTADEYLSGNIYQKIDDAKEANQKFHTDLFNAQIADLEKVIPKKLDFSDISVEVGARWLDPEIYTEFFRELFKDDLDSDFTFVYNKSVDQFSKKSSYRNDLSSYNYDFYHTYGNDDYSATDLFVKMLNFNSFEVKKTIDKTDENGQIFKTSVLDEELTKDCMAKAALLQEKFKEWIFLNDERREKLTDKYNRLFNAIKPREYNGDLFSFDGINPNIQLRPHQKNAIARTLLGGNSLLAHEVGAGKTFEMCASAMEKLRLGLAHKCVIVTPNPVLEQFSKEFYTLYPNANILTATKKDFTKANRANFLARAAYGDANIILMSKEQFEKIPMSQQYQSDYIQSKIDQLDLSLKEAQGLDEKDICKKIETRKNQLRQKLGILEVDNTLKDQAITFEELGCDALFVDEAHNYKNAYLESFSKTIPLPPASKRAQDMQMKCEYLNQKFDNKAVVFATGTAISNSVIDLYTMQTYLNQPALKAAGINSVDSFVAQFGSIEAKAELDPTGQNFRMKTRLRSFRNIPDLMKIFGEVADIKTQHDIKDLLTLPKANYHYVESPASDFQKEYIKEIAARAIAVHERTVPPEEDNMLKISTDGRKLGLDPRIIDPMAPDDPNSKVNKCVENVYDIYEKETPNKSAQLIFCDMSTPTTSAPFNVYDDIKTKLVDHGIPENEIAFIHDYDGDDARDQLFEDVKKGKVRVLLGSTSKLGTGVNVQTRLKAVHHLDINWRPSDLEQRNGRIIRQGNKNPEVDIYNYISNGTFDAFMYQTVMTKAAFIDKIMKDNNHTERNINLEDEEPTFSYSECMAAAVGDNRIKQKIELESKLDDLKLEKKMWEKQYLEAKANVLTNYPDELNKLKRQTKGCKLDLEKLDQSYDIRLDPKKFIINLKHKDYTDKKEAGQAILSAVATLDVSHGEVGIGTYCGFGLYVKKLKTTCTKDCPGGLKNVLYAVGPSNTRSEILIGSDAVGNITRLNNALNGLYKKMDDLAKSQKEIEAKIESSTIFLKEHDHWERQNVLDDAQKEYDQLLKDLEIETDAMVNDRVNGPVEEAEISPVEPAVDEYFDVNGKLIRNQQAIVPEESKTIEDSLPLSKDCCFYFEGKKDDPVLAPLGDYIECYQAYEVPFGRVDKDNFNTLLDRVLKHQCYLSLDDMDGNQSLSADTFKLSTIFNEKRILDRDHVEVVSGLPRLS